MNIFDIFGIHKATDRDKQLIWHLIQAKNSGLPIDEYMKRFRAWSALNQEQVPFPEGVSMDVISPEEKPEVEDYLGDAIAQEGGHHQPYPSEDVYNVDYGFPHSRSVDDSSNPRNQNLQNMLWKMFGIEKAVNPVEYELNEDQYNLAWSHFVETLVHPSNSGYTHDEDGRVIPSVTDEETPKDQQDENPEEALSPPEDLNIRKAWHHFLGAVGPWYARGLYGRVHRLPHEDSSEDSTQRLSALYPDDEITPAERYMSRYEPNPEQYVRQSDYSAPNQWHTREDFEDGIPGQEHPNRNPGGVRTVHFEPLKFGSTGHHSFKHPHFDDEKSAHNQIYDNHWFGSHRYWGPYTEHWLKTGKDSPDFGGHKVTVDNGEEGYHPDIYAKHGGETAQALPFLDPEVVYRHHNEDWQRNMHGPDPVKWKQEVYDEWAGFGTSVYHHPLDYKNKYWKNAAPRSREQRPDQPGDYFPRQPGLQTIL